MIVASRLRGLLVLLFHDVHLQGRNSYRGLSRSATMYHLDDVSFRRHLAVVERASATIVRPAEIEGRLDQPAAAACALTFDDGWRGTFEVGGPILAERGLSALVFVTAGFIGREHFADASLLRAQDRGPFTIGCHGLSHRMLSSLSRGEIRQELTQSKDQLEQLLGREVNALSVPGGATSDTVRSEAAEAGFRMVFDSHVTVNPTRHGKFAIARACVTKRTTPETLARWLSGNMLRERLRAAVLGLPKGVLGMRRYSELRRLLFRRAGADEEYVFTP